nr:hypothetical protein [bacterium]
MNLIACEEIDWHDCVIRSVLISPVNDQVELLVDYPVNWDENQWAPRVLKFLDAHGYKEYEGPFAGTPTILAATSSTQQNGWKLIRLDTNAGFREVFCKGISLELPATG